ncbi:xanthine dehydrogenase molybdopterin binding subunit [Myxococcota bacterium]|nr:xanthine dehydrogenase molybdopterin binding subunit [Myxococcota bacterium]
MDAKRSHAQPAKSPLHEAAEHESGLKHTSGEALYVDDLPAPPTLLHGHVVTSPHAHARVVARDGAKARAVPGVRAVLFHDAIPGHNQIGAIADDEPVLAEGVVEHVGQTVALVLADTAEAARKAAALVEVSYEPLEPTLTVADAIAKGAFLTTPHVITRGDVDAALASAPIVLEGEVENGAQEHFYLETNVALALPEEGRALTLYSSTQHPSEVQHKLAHMLGVGRHEVTVIVPRLGGGFGGKETQAARFAALAALGAHATKRPVKVWLNRDQDMEQTGRRHPFWTQYRAGFDRDGQLLALDAKIWANGGFSNDLSRSICDRALFHTDNAYYLPNVRLRGQVVKTNLPSNTAFRGFGGPQGVLVIESILDRIARHLGLDPAAVRERNLYGAAPRDVTPYHQIVTDNRMPRLWRELVESSDYLARRAAIERANATSTSKKRGLAIVPVKFGISFTASFLNQAGAYVLVYADGSVQLNHGGIEMGQGLHTKMLAICAHTLGVEKEKIRAMSTATDKVPNTSATAASSGADLNGQAVKAACDTIRERMRPIAAKLLGTDPDDAIRLVFEGGRIFHPENPEKSVEFSAVANAAYFAQVPLAATGYYRTPDIHYDRDAGRGKPFHYFSYGAAVTEVEVSGLTGEHRILRVDILHDVGDSLVPTIDVGQIEGAFVQGAGWLTCEEVIYDAKGRLVTHSPDTYKIPAIGDVPEHFRVKLLERAPQPGVIHGSKAVGEPPLMLAISVVGALRHAIGAFGPERSDVALALPATPEAILRAIEHQRGP